MIRLRAPAKLNLYLRVLGKRPDGYHELETLFERIDLCDELTFEAQPRGLRLTCTDSSLPCQDDNLVQKAARLLQEANGTRQGASIRLVKRIPIAAGLGGGSSNAAAALVGLNRLWGLGLDRPRLLEFGGQLGADVPFFLHQVPFALGRGRGERCEPIETPLRLAHVLVVPEARLSTKEIYEGFDRHGFDPSTPLGITSQATRGGFDLTASTPSIRMVAHALRNGSLGELAEGLWNDLEPEAIRRCPVIGLIQSHVRALGCLGTRISGKGPSVFGLCRNAAHAHEVAEGLRAAAPPSWRIEVIQTEEPVCVGTPVVSSG